MLSRGCWSEVRAGQEHGQGGRFKRERLGARFGQNLPNQFQLEDGWGGCTAQDGFDGTEHVWIIAQDEVE